MKLEGNTILITGGGSGIGRGLAEAFHKLGNKVIIAGRRKDVLDETTKANPGMLSLELNIQDPEAIKTFARQIVGTRPDLNVLINNAGVMRDEDLSHSRVLTVAEETISTNLLGTIRMTDAFVEHLVAARQAAIINVSSGLAFVPRVPNPTYSATKAAIHSYTLSLREQLKGKVEVIELIPPGVKTELTSELSTRDGYMSLADFIHETMALFAAEPAAQEICVKQVRPLRFAEEQKQFQELFRRVNPKS